MPLTLDGTNGVSAVQAGAVESGDLPAGSVLQVVTAEKTNVFSLSGNSPFTDVTGLSVSITPRDSNSQFLVILSLHGSSNGSNFQPFTYRIARGGTPILASASGIGGVQGVENFELLGSGVSVAFDSPATAATVTYSAQVKGEGNTLQVVNESINGTRNSASSITVMEIAG